MSNQPELGGNDQLDSIFRSVKERIDRLEAENRSLIIERERLTRSLDEAERRSALAARLLRIAQQESQKRVEDAIRAGESLRQFAEKRALELRGLADATIANAAHEADRLEREARAESGALSAEIDRLVLAPSVEPEATVRIAPIKQEPSAPAPAPVVPPAPVVSAAEPVVPPVMPPLAPPVPPAPAIAPMADDTILRMPPADADVLPAWAERFREAADAAPVAEPVAPEPVSQPFSLPRFEPPAADLPFVRPNIPTFAEPVESAPAHSEPEPAGKVLPMWAAIDRMKAEEARNADQTLRAIHHEESPEIEADEAPAGMLDHAEQHVTGEQHAVVAEQAEGGAGMFELVASPFNSFSTLVAFQRAVKTIPDVDDVRAKSFLNGALHLTMRYTGAEPISERLKNLQGFRPERMAVTGTRIDLIVVPDESAVETGRSAFVSGI